MTHEPRYKQTPPQLHLRGSDISLYLHCTDHIPAPTQQTMSEISPHRLFQISEIIELILGHVPPVELLGSCRAVCRVWNEVVSTSWLLKYYSITGLHPTQRLSAISLLQLTPAARSILSLFWEKLYALVTIPGIKERRNEFLTELYRLYTSYKHPFQTIALFQPPPGHQGDLSYYNVVFTPPLRCGDRHEIGRAFEVLFAQDDEELLQNTYPLQNIAYTLCENAYYVENHDFLRKNPFYSSFYAHYGSTKYFIPRSVLFKVEVPQENGRSSQGGKPGIPETGFWGGSWSGWETARLKSRERYVSAEFSVEGSFSVATRQVGY
ncbi:hypothetical protein TWF281_004811 [Arthrobotrys megalospora]